jgi:hypothetical protein
MNKTTIIIIATLLCFKYSSAQNPFPKQLIGAWINLEYETALGNDSLNEKVRALISPRFLFFDSLGNCGISTMVEHKPKVVKPISSRKFGDAFQFTYIINKSRVTVNQIEDNDSLLYISFVDIPVSIVFKRYK